ncbi:MAG: hypothetical protein HY763_05185 [Planctomycetes bacterium]|nr:hypothetical protein [Planctomycetota bacterium]
MSAALTGRRKSGRLAAAIPSAAEVARLLRRCLPPATEGGPAPRAVRVERCWPASEDACSLEWSFRLGAGPPLALFGHLDLGTGKKPCRAEPPEAEPAPRRVAGRLWDVRVCVPESGLCVHSPDTDPVLRQLRGCLDGAAMARRLAEALGGPETGRASAGHQVSAELLGYRAGRRATIRFTWADADGDSLIGKTFRDDRASRLLSLHLRLGDQLRRATSFRVDVATPVAYLDDLKMGLFGGVAKDAAAKRALTERRRVEAAAVALAALHATLPGDLPRFTVEDECGIVERWARFLALVGSAHAPRMGRLVERLREAAAAVPAEPPRTIHRDFYEKQMILGPRRTVLLDLDTLARGSASVDLGNFLAHLLMRCLSSGGSPAEFARHAAAFRRCYEADGQGVDRRGLSFYFSSALVRLGAIHSLRSATCRFTGALWKAAEEAMDRCRVPVSVPRRGAPRAAGAGTGLRSAGSVGA